MSYAGWVRQQPFWYSQDRTIKKMTYGSDSYSKSKDKTVGLLNNDHVSKQIVQTTPLKEEVALTQTNSDTKTKNTNNNEE